MEKVKKLLEEREKDLIRLKRDKEKELRNVPEGALRICSHGNRIQYYHRKDSKDPSGIYMPEKERDLASKLAQKEYDQKVLRAVDKELSVVRKYLTNYPETNAEQIYEKLHKERQKLIVPILETEEQYIQKWEAVQYHGKGFEESMPELYTAKNERVRSKSELIIADLLNKEAIPYRYECPIYLKGVGQIYPDFTVLNIKKRTEFYWEHLGMMDDSSYAEKALLKITLYEQNGIFPGEKLILTHETRKNPLNQKLVMNIIQHYLK